jgi:hypothetical protein
MSHELLDDLVQDVPRHVVPDADRAWRAGAARRRRRYVAEGLAVAAAVALVGAGLVRLHDHTPVQPAGEVVVDGHPASVPKPWHLPDLPDRPGPMAGAMSWHENDDTRSWVFISASGKTYRMPSEVNEGWTQPLPSDDGRWVAFLRTDDATTPDGTFVLKDLVSGDEQLFPTIGTNQGSSPDPWMTEAQTPGFWSPDDSQVIVYGFAADDPADTALLLTTSGGFTPLSVAGRPLGWLDDARVAWLTRDGESFVVTDTRGQVLQAIDLPTRLRGLSQWSGRLSPDGSRVAVLHGERLSTYSMTTGERLQGGTSETIQLFPASTPMWHGDDVLLWDGHGYVDAFSGDRVISVSSRWGDLAFSHWAADAVDGPVHAGPSVLDWRYWPFLWWKQLVAVVGVLLVVALIRRRRPERPTPGAPSPPTDD